MINTNSFGTFTFVLPSRNSNFIPALTNSGCAMNSKRTEARSPVRNKFCGWSMETMRTVCRTACVRTSAGAAGKQKNDSGTYATVQHSLIILLHRGIVVQDQDLSFESPYRWPINSEIASHQPSKMRGVLRTSRRYLRPMHDHHTFSHRSTGHVLEC